MFDKNNLFVIPCMGTDAVHLSDFPSKKLVCPLGDLRVTSLPLECVWMKGNEGKKKEEI